jgi:hypothetical protein
MKTGVIALILALFLLVAIAHSIRNVGDRSHDLPAYALVVSLMLLLKIRELETRLAMIEIDRGQG